MNRGDEMAANIETAERQSADGAADSDEKSEQQLNTIATRRWSRSGDARNRQTEGRRRRNPCEDYPTSASTAATRCPCAQARADSAAIIASAAHVAITNATTSSINPSPHRFVGRLHLKMTTTTARSRQSLAAPTGRTSE